MTPFDLVLARLLLAAAGSLAAGAAVWSVALLCRRWLPALAQQRTVWLLGQATVAVVFVALLAPTTSRLRVAPLIEIAEPVAARPVAAVAPASAHPVAAPAPAAAPVSTPPHAWLRDAARAWCVVYLLGLAVALLRWRRAHHLLDGLVASGQPLTAPAEHAGLATFTGAGLPAVIEVDAFISPMLQGLLKPRLLLPRHLRDFSALQQGLIVEHELTHWRRRDLHWSAAALVFESLFWFNPFMRLLRARLGWAQEFGCDRDVLRGRPQAERKAYAAALVAQLKLQQHPAGMALAFGAGGGAPTLAARIALIRTPGAPRAAWSRPIALAALAAAAVANLALQPALGWRAAAMPVSGVALLTHAWPRTASATSAPLDCTVMVDAATGASLVREGTCDERVSPLSTFKIAISLMGFDSGVLRDAHTPYLPYKTSYASPNPSWRHGTDPASWLRESVVWYSQQVTARLGAARVRGYVQAFDYGNRELADVDGVPDAVALSELSPTLKISPAEQAVFLRKVVNRDLPLSPHAYELTARLLKRDQAVNGWTVYGKTGTGAVQRADGTDIAGQQLGWYVGWTVKDGRTLVFARLMQHPLGGDAAGARTRDTFLAELARRVL